MAEPLDPAAFYAELGARVKAARVRCGITQTELAAALGLTRSSIANLEGGRQHPPIHTIVELAGLLDFEVPGVVVSDRPAALLATTAEQALAELSRAQQALVAIMNLAHDARWPREEANHG